MEVEPLVAAQPVPRVGVRVGGGRRPERSATVHRAKTWEFRPIRAEPLHAIAFRYRKERQYRIAYLFAERAAQTPLPEEDVLFVSLDGDLLADLSNLTLDGLLGDLGLGDIANISVDNFGGLVTELADTVPAQILAAL
jgi:hypothetical protein